MESNMQHPQNRHSINSYFPLLQELIVIIIQKDCRQARYVLIHWQRCQYCIIWKLNCIQFSSEQFDHCWITVWGWVTEAIKMRHTRAFITMFISSLFYIVPEFSSKSHIHGFNN